MTQHKKLRSKKLTKISWNGHLKTPKSTHIVRLPEILKDRIIDKLTNQHLYVLPMAIESGFYRLTKVIFGKAFSSKYAFKWQKPAIR